MVVMPSILASLDYIANLRVRSSKLYVFYWKLILQEVNYYVDDEGQESMQSLEESQARTFVKKSRLLARQQDEHGQVQEQGLLQTQTGFNESGRRCYIAASQLSRL